MFNKGDSNGSSIWWYSTESETILNNGYLLKGETLEGAIDRISTAAAVKLKKTGLKRLLKR